MNIRKMGRWAAAIGAVEALAGTQALVQIVGAMPASAAGRGCRWSPRGARSIRASRSRPRSARPAKRVIGTGSTCSAVRVTRPRRVRPRPTRTVAAAGQVVTTANWKISSWGRAVGPSGLEVDVVGAEPAQRRLDGAHHVAPGAPGAVVGAVAAAHVHAELRGDHHVVAAAGEGRAEELLRRAPARRRCRRCRRG